MKGEYSHPRDSKQKVKGRLLCIGEIPKKDDVYDAPSGKWEPVPEELVGNPLRLYHDAILVRPEK